MFAYRNGTEGAGFDSKAIKNYPRNEGIIQNSVFIRKFAGQDVTSDPVAFESSNYIANPDLSQAFGPGRTKWALGASVIASSNVNDYGWTLANVVDGIWSSKAGAAGTVNGWSSNSNLGADHTEWIQIDLGQSRTISEVDLWASDRDTIYSQLSIGFTQAALGDSLEVDTVDGKVKLQIPAGTQSGEKLRLKGKGVPHGRGC